MQAFKIRRTWIIREDSALVVPDYSPLYLASAVEERLTEKWEPQRHGIYFSLGREEDERALQVEVVPVVYRMWDSEEMTWGNSDRF